MNAQAVLDACTRKPGAYLNCPFGPGVVCARLGKRIFAEVYLDRPWLTLCCDPPYGLEIRQAYPDAVRRGYHCPPSQQPYHNTITLDGTVPDEVLLQMLDHSYERVLRCMTRAQRQAALEGTAET